MNIGTTILVHHYDPDDGSGSEPFPAIVTKAAEPDDETETVTVLAMEPGKTAKAGKACPQVHATKAGLVY